MTTVINRDTFKAVNDDAIVVIDRENDWLTTTESGIIQVYDSDDHNALDGRISKPRTFTVFAVHSSETDLKPGMRVLVDANRWSRTTKVRVSVDGVEYDTEMCIAERSSILGVWE